MMVKKLIMVAALATLVLGASSCVARGGASPMNPEDYKQALDRFPGSEAGIAAGVERFEAGFADLTRDDLKVTVSELYAERLFFNDTLKTFHDRESLADYLARTGAGLESSEIEIDRVIVDGADVYLRWTMHFTTRAVGREIDSRSIGMTHLRFNAAGEIVLHQDFWDSGQALYAKLPVVGFFIRRARAAMD